MKPEKTSEASVCPPTAGLRRFYVIVPPSITGRRSPGPFSPTPLFHFDLHAHPGMNAAFEQVFALGEAIDL
jgi:hypothetical protein